MTLTQSTHMKNHVYVFWSTGLTLSGQRWHCCLILCLFQIHSILSTEDPKTNYCYTHITFLPCSCYLSLWLSFHPSLQTDHVLPLSFSFQQKSVGRKKCAACKIVAHTLCIEQLEKVISRVFRIILPSGLISMCFLETRNIKSWVWNSRHPRQIKLEGIRLKKDV